MIPFARVECSGRELEYVGQVLASGWLTCSSRVVEFEERFAAWVGAPYACAVNSCTAALHLALEALGVGPGDRVMVPSMTFTTTAEVIRYLGADPVFLDCDPDTRLLTPAIVQRALRQHPGVKALMVVHFAGQAAAMLGSGGEPGIIDICRAHGVKVVEDAAHAFPTRHQGVMVGGLGDVTCFSFYANKTITTGEGGMLVTADEAVWLRAKVMRLHGIDRDVWERYTKPGRSWDYDVVAPGFKYNMPDINAAIGLAQLERAAAMRERREYCCRYYHRALAGIAGLRRPRIDCSWEDHSCHLYPVLITDQAPLSRDEFIAALARRGIGAAVHYKPLHRMSYYRHRYRLDPADFPNSEAIWRGTVSLPLYPGLQEAELATVVENVTALLAAKG